MELRGACVVVTGAGSGIGRVLAKEFAQQDAHVICVGRQRDRLDSTVGLIEQTGGTALAITADITDIKQVGGVVSSVESSIGPIDVLFNNAGRFEAIGGIHEIDPEQWWQDVSVNLRGGFLMMNAVLPAMVQRNRGVIINMDGGRPTGGSGYACGKAGLMELTRIAAAELRLLERDVVVLSAGPGLVKTEMTRKQAESAAGRRWIPSTGAAFTAKTDRKAEDIAVKTMEILRIVEPAHSGMHFQPDTDTLSWLPGGLDRL